MHGGDMYQEGVGRNGHGGRDGGGGGGGGGRHDQRKREKAHGTSMIRQVAVPVAVTVIVGVGAAWMFQ